MWIQVGVPECLVLFWGHSDLDLWHIFFIIGDMNPNSMWIYLVLAECHSLFLDHGDLDLWSYLCKSIVVGGIFDT